MRFGTLRLAPASAAFFLLAACGGGGGDGGGGTNPPPTPVPTTVTITSAAIALDEIGETAVVTATVRDQNGAPISSPSLGFSSSNTGAATVTSGGVVTATGDGTATITVTSGSASAQTVATVTVAVLGSGQPVSGLGLAGGSARLFTFEVAPGAGVGKVLEFATNGADGDADLIVRFGSAPVPPSGFDCISLTGSSIETCAIANPQSGTWFISLEAAETFTNLTLAPRLVDIPAATDGAPVSGLAAGFNEFTYVAFDVPGASAPPLAANRVIVGDLVAEKGGIDFRGLHGTTSLEDDEPNGPELMPGSTLTIATSGGAGDVDLFGLPGVLWSRTGGVPPCVSAVDGNVESCVVDAPQAGSWVFALYGFQAFSGVSMTVDYDAGGGPTPGTLTVQKVIQSSTGGAADNPASPTLSGFQFEVRPAGGGAVIQTITTDASGVAQATLDPGSYDVTESNAQGLTDVTSAANGVAVPEGGNVDVQWINRQAAGGGGPTPGTLTVQKVVQSSTGGTADNPASPTLSGFQFEVRPAGGGAVIQTITTNGSGVAQATLDAGSYDVSESNAQGLTDVTSAANSVAVPEGGNVDVQWINRQAAPVNSPPDITVSFSPEIAASDGNSTVVYFNARDSSDPDGDPLTFAWTSPTGTFLGGTSGSFTRATFPSAPATVTLTVSDGNGGESQEVINIAAASALPPAGTYNIELVNVATPSATVQNALNAAKATWESIIRNELPNLDFSDANMGAGIAADTCVDGQPAFADIVDDVRIFVNIAPIDGPGGTLGRAGPCFTRLSDGTTVVGSMQFDSEDLAGMSATVLNAVILHEMAHVFGIGTLWSSKGFLDNPSCPGGSCTSSDPPGPDTRYTGSAGASAWLSIGGSLSQGGAPVENGDGVSAGPGTRDGHWREILLQTELMTGFVSPSSNPLSHLTLAALADVGLDQLDFSVADDYTVPVFGAPMPAWGGLGVHMHDDIRVGPIWVVDDAGRVIGVRETGR